MFDFFRRKPTPPATRVHVVEAQPPKVNIRRVTGDEFRPGMWVVVGEQVGILKSMNGFGVCAVMLTDSDGLNALEMQVPLGELRRAKQGEIPAKRVAHLSSADLTAMGYEQ